MPDLEDPDLENADSHLRGVLSEAGYSELTYFVLDDGFAQVTRLEKIDAEGRADSGSDRFAGPSTRSRFACFAEFLKSGFGLREGRYRLFAVVVTAQNFTKGSRKMTRDEAAGWIDEGLVKLPVFLSRLPYSEDHVCTVLVYEFEAGRDGETTTIERSDWEGKTHLDKAGILAVLNRQ